MKFSVKIAILCFIIFCFENRGFSQEIKFLSTTYHYGSITKNQDGRGLFKFINTGDAPLVISNVKSSCGCLVPFWLRKPVQPGDTAIIGCRYDTKRIGPIHKSITVISNAINKPTLVLRIKGFVYQKYVELVQSNFNFDLGTITFNEFKTIDIELGSKDSVSKIWLKNGRDKLIEPNPYSDMMKFSKDEISDWRKKITLNFTNIYGDVGKKSYTFNIQYNNKEFATISITANFIGYPGNKIFNFRDTLGYVYRKNTYYYSNNQLTKIVVEEKRKYENNPTFKVSEIKKYSDGNIDVVEKWRYYSNKKYISFYRLEENELILIETKEEEL